MPRGGARNRSGPPADPNSGRSDRRGYALSDLPARGYDGPVPDFPLPNPSERELVVWEQAWRTPQACAWSVPSEAWRATFVADWVRVKVRTEAVDAPAGLFAARMRLEDRIGFSTAGLAEMGWKIKADEVAQRAADRATETAAPARKSSRDRILKVASSGGA